MRRKEGDSKTLRPATAVASLPQQMTIQQTLELAVSHQNAGNLSTAEKLYQKILMAKPDETSALHLLGVISYQRGDYQKAARLIRKTLRLQPTFAEAHNNLGLVLKKLGDPEAALACYRKAVSIKHNYLDAYNNLGNAFRDSGNLNNALTNYQTAQALNPNDTEISYNVGTTLFELGRVEDAIITFGKIKTPRGLVQSQAHILECLFALGEYDRFYQSQEKFGKFENTNIRIAAINAFASQQLNTPNPHPFCKNPLNFVRVYDIVSDTDPKKDFLIALIDHLKNIDAVWEPSGKTTIGGFQTTPTLFRKPTGDIARLEQTIKEQIELYYSEFVAETCDFISSFPRERNLSGWFVRLVNGGHQTEHIHVSGWLSGVFYLQIPQTDNPEEGGIEVGLWGYDYPILKNNYPKQRYYPKAGRLILFPSSLFHRTLPFHSNEERLCIAFDLVPD